MSDGKKEAPLDLKALDERLQDYERFRDELVKAVVSIKAVELSQDPVAAGGPRYLSQKTVEALRVIDQVWKLYRDATFRCGDVRKFVNAAKGLKTLLKKQKDDDVQLEKIDALLDDGGTLLTNLREAKATIGRKYSEAQKLLDVVRDQTKIVGWEWNAATHQPVSPEDLEDIFKDDKSKPPAPMAQSEPPKAETKSEPPKSPPAPKLDGLPKCGACGKPATKTVTTGGQQFPICDECEAKRQAAGAKPADPAKKPEAKAETKPATTTAPAKTEAKPAAKTEPAKTETPKPPPKPDAKKPGAPAKAIDDLSDEDFANVVEKEDQAVAEVGDEVVEGDFDDMIDKLDKK